MWTCWCQAWHTSCDPCGQRPQCTGQLGGHQGPAPHHGGRCQNQDEHGQCQWLPQPPGRGGGQHTAHQEGRESVHRTNWVNDKDAWSHVRNCSQTMCIKTCFSRYLNGLQNFKFCPVFVNIASANGVSVSHVDRQWLGDPGNTDQVNSLQGIQLRGGSHVSADQKGALSYWVKRELRILLKTWPLLLRSSDMGWQGWSTVYTPVGYILKVLHYYISSRRSYSILKHFTGRQHIISLEEADSWGFIVIFKCHSDGKFYSNAHWQVMIWNLKHGNIWDS